MLPAIWRAGALIVMLLALGDAPIHRLQIIFEDDLGRDLTLGIIHINEGGHRSPLVVGDFVQDGVWLDDLAEPFDF